MQKQKLFLGLVCMGMSLLFNQCKKETENTGPLPPAGDAESWVTLANEDIQSLGNIVRAIKSEDAVEHIRMEDELVHLEMHNGATAQVRIDYASYPAPLVGAHLIDKNYYWTIINGTGTSSTRLIKDNDRKNQNIEDEAVPRMLVNNAGNWAVEMKGIQEEIADADGKPFRAIGRKSLFNSVSFDIDSNVTVITNESPNRTYTLPRYRPFTFLLDRSETDILTIASGFAIAVDFKQVGVEELEFDLPTAWSASYELNAGQKSGVLQITSPTGMEAEFAEEGIITVRAKDQYGRQLIRQIPVKVEVGVVNYASVTFKDIVAGVELTGATFTFAENLTSTNIKDVTAIKAGETFRLMIPDGFPNLRKVNFATASGNFDYYFKPNTYLSIGDQDLSIAPPVLTSYWQGGMIVHINEILPISGIARYKITGKVIHVQSPDANIPWFPNGNVSVTAASSDTDGTANTAAIINALGGVGTSANYIARWAIRVRDGGYSDWYLGALQDYEYFHQTWAPSPFSPNSTATAAPYGDAAYEAARIAFNNKIASYGGNIKLRDTHNLFWTSTNISTTHAKAYDVRYSTPYTTGQKIYGARGLAFRNF